MSDERLRDAQLDIINRYGLDWNASPEEIDDYARQEQEVQDVVFNR